ncbi:glycosyltransferase [Kiritimatiellota bacterium B12222]|nr:glycosyltransferase [Kiritimatiellota bacterium B12222]
MNENTRLGISIPTYKRPDELRKCVASVQASAEAYGVPIYIVDDAADDTNLALFEELKAAYPFMHISRNEQNLGIDRNIQQAANVCNCDYVWLMGEDDRMVPHGVKTVLEVLENEEPPFVYVNYSGIDNDMSFVIKDRSLPFHENKRMDAEEFYRTISWSMGFIGACVIQKQAWNPIDETPFLDSFFAHVGRIMSAIAGKEVIMIAEPLILNRCGTPEAFSWTGDAVDVFTGWEKMTKELTNVYSDEAGQESLKNFKKAHGIGSLKLLAYLRADGVYTSEMRSKFIDPADPLLYRSGAWLIAILPCWPWKFLRSGLMKIRKWRSPVLDLPQ